MPKKKKRKPKSKKLIPLNVKALGSDISAYPFVEIEWSDIEGDAGWSSTKDLNKKNYLYVYLKAILLVKKMVLLEYLQTI